MVKKFPAGEGGGAERVKKSPSGEGRGRLDMGKIKCECCLGEGIVRPLGCPHGMPCPICHGTKKIDESMKKDAIQQRGGFLGEAFLALLLGGVFMLAYVLYNLYKFIVL